MNLPRIDREQIFSSGFIGTEGRSELHLTESTQVLRQFVREPANESTRPTMTDVTRPELDARFKENEAKIAASEAKVGERLANFDASIKTGFAELRADMAKMQSEVHKGTADLIKWAIGLAISVVVMTVGLMTFINKTVDKPQGAPAQAPIIITTPGATATPMLAPPAK
jgi:hypothetical protein